MTAAIKVEKIENLEKEMIGVQHTLHHQNEILVKIEGILATQSKTLENLLVVQQRMNNVEEDVKELKDTFEARKKVTDENNQSFRQFADGSRTGIRVAVSCFVLVQSILGWILVENYKKLEKTYEVATHVEKRLSIVEEKQRIYLDSRQNSPRPSYQIDSN